MTIVDARLRPRLERGEIVIENADPAHGGKGAVARALIAAPVEKVWEAITDFDNYKDFMPFTSASEVRKREGDVVHFYSELAVPLKKVWYVIAITIDKPNWRTSWHIVEGSLRANDGSWRLEPWGERETAAEYTSHVDIGISVPGFLLNKFTASGLSSLLQAVRKRVGDAKYR